MSPQVLVGDSKLFLSALQTLFSGGMFLLLLGIVWRGSSFVTWVRCQFAANDEAHERLEGSVDRIKSRISVMEDE